MEPPDLRPPRSLGRPRNTPAYSGPCHRGGLCAPSPPATGSGTPGFPEVTNSGFLGWEDLQRRISSHQAGFLGGLGWRRGFRNGVP